MAKENLDHEYAGITGVPEFCTGAAKLAFGNDSKVISSGRNATTQSISGKGLITSGERVNISGKFWKD